MLFRRLALLLSLFIASIAHGQPSDFAVANGLADQSQHQNAIELYRQIEFSGNVSAELFYNLANSYVALDSFALAILYYEKALKINPGHAASTNNLQIVHNLLQLDIIDIPDFILFRKWRAIYMALPANAWAVISLLFLVLLASFLYYLWFYRGRHVKRRISIPIVLLLLMGFMTFAWAGWQRKNSLIHSREGIVMVSSFLKSGPDPRSNDVKLLKPGYKIFIIDQLEGWHKVRTEDREVGWFHPDHFEEI